MGGCRCSRPQEQARSAATATSRHPPTVPGARSDIRASYKLGPVLGCGSFGQVKACEHRQTEQQFACKIMVKGGGRRGNSKVDYIGMFQNEIEILRSLNHPNVVRLMEVFEDKHFLYAILERCEGGELFSRIVQRRKFMESDASRLCLEMIKAIQYVHSQGIIHRDVKAENFLFAHKLPPGFPGIRRWSSAFSHSSANNTNGSYCNRQQNFNRLVLIDFGMSIKVSDPQKRLRQVCGSPHYVAPELIRRSYRHEVDLWALGVVTFLMLYGRYPFEGTDQKQIAQRILRTEPEYSRTSTKPSASAIEFIKGLLQKDPAKRFTPTQAANHEWIISGGMSRRRAQTEGSLLTHTEPAAYSSGGIDLQKEFVLLAEDDEEHNEVNDMVVEEEGGDHDVDDDEGDDDDDGSDEGGHGQTLGGIARDYSSLHLDLGEVGPGRQITEGEEHESFIEEGEFDAFDHSQAGNVVDGDDNGDADQIIDVGVEDEDHSGGGDEQGVASGGGSVDVVHIALQRSTAGKSDNGNNWKQSRTSPASDKNWLRSAAIRAKKQKQVQRDYFMRDTKAPLL